MKRIVLLSVVCVVFAIESPAGSSALFGSENIVRPDREFDVLHYRIDVSFDTVQKSVHGVTSVTFVPLRAKLDSIVLNGVAMEIQSVSMGKNQNLKFANDGKYITVYLGKEYGFRDSLLVHIRYTCKPAKGLYFRSADSLNPARKSQIWTQGEDMDNRHWFPSWDFPNDKATSEVIGTVNEAWTLLSNGTLVNVSHDKTKKTKTFHWKQAKPHVSYLVMLAAGEYHLVSEKYNTIPIQYYLYPDRVEDGKRSLAATPEALGFLEKITDFPYPWEKYAQVYLEDFMWGGMENTSAVTLNTSYLIDKQGMIDFTADDVIAHELAHQWFGDLVTCRDWTELWLNEGFANYYESLFKLGRKGRDEFELDLMNQSSSVLGVERSQGRRPVRSEDSYTTNLYAKGAWVLYMLNSMIGDEEFHRAMRLYVKRNAFTSVGTADLQKAIEDATGRNLDWFFEQWIYKAGHPQFEVTSSWDSAAHQLTLTVEQTQTLDSLTGLFVVPLDIEYTTSSGTFIKPVVLSRQREVITVDLPERPLMVIFDKGMKVLKTLKFDRPREELAYQLRHASDISARITAAKELAEFRTDTMVMQALRKSALSDPFWGVRRECVRSLAAVEVDGTEEALRAACADEKSTVRASAVDGLSRFTGSVTGAFVERILLSDSSYLVQSICLRTLADVDTVRALKRLEEFAHRTSHRHIVRRAALQGLRQLRSTTSLRVGLEFLRLGNATDIRAMALSLIRDQGEEDEAARLAVHSLTNDPDRTIRKGAITTLGVWGGPDVRPSLEARRSVESDEDVLKLIDKTLRSLTN